MFSVHDKVLHDEQVELLDNSTAEVGIFMLLDSQDSGFVLEGTERLPEPQTLRFPSRRTILLTSAYAKPTLKDKTKFDRVRIRHIKGCPTLSPDEQKQKDYEPNPAEDQITFKNGIVTIVGEGITKTTLDFMRLDSRNETSKFRLPGVKAVYKEIFPEAEREGDNDSIFEEASAIKFLETLIQGKGPKGQFLYDEDRLAALATLHGVIAETPAHKIAGLISVAKRDPKHFLELSKEFEETISTDILHGIQLRVITVSNTSIRYIGKEKVIVTFSGALSESQKIRKLMTHFQTNENDYKEFMAELQLAKERSV